MYLTENLGHVATGNDEGSGTRACAHPNPDPSISDQQMQYLKIHIALGVRSMPVPQHRNVHAGHMVLTSSNFGFDMQSIMPWLLDSGGSLEMQPSRLWRPGWNSLVVAWRQDFRNRVL